MVLALLPLALAGTARDAWGRKPVLEVTLAGRWDRLAECGLDSRQIALLRSLAHDVAGDAEEWRRSGNAAIRAGRSPDAPMQRAALAALSSQEADGTEEIVGDALPCVLDRLDEAWEDDRARSQPVFSANQVTYNVFATQYDANTDDEVAVPDDCIKFANLGWSTCSAGYASPPYDVLLDNGGTTYTAWVGDVGPWNIDDNYWDSASDASRPRRRFTDLAQGTNESRAAYYDDYNGGEDQYGRTVGNPAGIDLAPDTAAHIGLAYLENAWIDVTWLWEATLTYPSMSFGITQDARADQPSDSRGDDGIYDVYPGQTWTVTVSVTNSGTEKANNVTLGAWAEAPYVGVTQWQSSDGTVVASPGDSFQVTMGGIDAGETETVTFTMQALSPSIGLADHPDLRVWMAHIDGYYEKSDFGTPASANAYQTWNGGDLAIYAQHDVWPLETQWDWEDGTDQGWWAGNAVTLTTGDGTVRLSGSGDDPYAIGPAVDASAAAFPTFSWRGAHLGAGPAVLYWTTSDAPSFSDENSVVLPVDDAHMADGSVEPGWSGTLTRLRIDPGPGADAILTLDAAGFDGPGVAGDSGGAGGADGAGLPGALVRLDGLPGCGCDSGGGGVTGVLVGLAAMAGGGRRVGSRATG